MMRVRSAIRANRSGSAVVELAVALPLLVGLLMGIWEVGRMIQVKQVISNAARGGGRLASTGARSVADVDTAVKNYLTGAGINTTGYTVKVFNITKNPTPDPNGASDDPRAADQMDQLRVIVSVPFNNVKWIFLDQLTPVTTLTSTSDWRAMRDKPLVVDSTMPN